MIRRALAVLLLVVTFCGACAKKPAPPPPPLDADKPLDDTPERRSLVNLAHGSCVVSRSGEAYLDLSAMRAADGDPGSFWATPPHDVPQSQVIALAAPSLINRVGFRTRIANRVRFETSLDGITFTPLITVTAKESKEAQWFTVTPAQAAFLRVTMLDRTADGRDPRLYSILASGHETEPPAIGRLDGTWHINGHPAVFVQRGNRVTGLLFLGKEPLRFAGASDGRVYRLAWVRGNDYGLSAVTVSADSKHLSGISWHEEAIPLFYADSWFGERGESNQPAVSFADVAVAHLRRVGRFPLFSDDAGDVAQLIKTAPVKLRLVAHQFREADSAKNLARAQRELAALQQALAARGVQIDGVAAGSADPRQKPVTEIMRAMYSSIDLEIRR